MSTTAHVYSIPICDLCGKHPAIVDARTTSGPWAYMCDACWQVHGLGQLGTGYGQQLVLREA